MEINAGNQRRFHDLVKKYEQPLYSFGLRMCGNSQDAEDMVQDTFLNVFRYLENFRFETRFKNWLYRVATSSCLKKKRKSKYAPEKELSLESFRPDKNDDVPTQMPDWAHVPLEQLLNEELSNSIKAAILDLPEKYRLVLVLRDIEGFSTQETAQILAVTQSNVKVRLHRARLFMRDRLKNYFNHD